MKWILAVFILTTLSGCATFAKERGYAVGRDDKRTVYPTCGEFKTYLSGAPIYKKVYDTGLAQIEFQLGGDQEVNYYSMGPSIFIPLPVIPWPFGIINSFLESEIKQLEFALHIRRAEVDGIVFDPVKVSILYNGMIVEPSSVKKATLDETNKFRSVALHKKDVYERKEKIFTSYNLVFDLKDGHAYDIKIDFSQLIEGVQLNDLSLHFYESKRVYALFTVNC